MKFQIYVIKQKTVFITKNGSGDLAVMSIELYELLTDRYDLYKELEKGFKLDKYYI